MVMSLVVRGVGVRARNCALGLSLWGGCLSVACGGGRTATPTADSGFDSSGPATDASAAEDAKDGASSSDGSDGGTCDVEYSFGACSCDYGLGTCACNGAGGEDFGVAFAGCPSCPTMTQAHMICYGM